MDLFSALPDDIMILMISFLPLLDAFRLCLARKEWHSRRLWVHCCSLELHETTFMSIPTRTAMARAGRKTLSTELKAQGRNRFLNFLNKTVFTLVSPVLSRFSFRMYYSVQYRSNIDLWVAFALTKHVQELSLDFSDGDPIDTQPSLRYPQYVLPKFIYKCGIDIRVLTLTCCCLGDNANFRGLPSLTTLTLNKLMLGMGEITNIVSSCPFLENLNLVECYGIIKVSISDVKLSLKRLVVKCCEPLSLGVELRLPSLEYFEYVGEIVRFHLTQMDCLADAMLDFGVDAPFPYQIDEVRNFLSVFSDARILKICSFALKIYPDEYLYLEPLFEPSFIEHLTLKSCMEPFEFPGILSLLRGSQHLQTLSIISNSMSPLVSEFLKEGYPELPEQMWTWKRGEWTLPRLRCVQMDGFMGKIYEIELLKFIMKHASRLSKIIIIPLSPVDMDAYLESIAQIESAEFASRFLTIQWR